MSHPAIERLQAYDAMWVQLQQLNETDPFRIWSISLDDSGYKCATDNTHDSDHDSESYYGSTPEAAVQMAYNAYVLSES